MHGWIILDKPLGLGSTQAVAAIKRLLRANGSGKVKVGHGGTLDPLATGVLPIALGEATKLSGRMLDSDKVYAFTIRFGEQTDTLDAEGEVIATSDVRPTREALDALLPRFTGPIEQAPPAFSAIKIDGRRAYDLARAGEAVEMKTRSVVIHGLTLRHPSEGWDRSLSGEDQAPPDPSLRWGDEPVDEVTLLAHVSKGTYIRSLARDIAQALGTVGHVVMLRREKAGPFTLDQAISLDKLAGAATDGALADHVLSLTAGLDDIPALPVTPEQAKALRQGRPLVGAPRRPGLMLATEGDVPVALVEALGPEIRVVRGFNI